MSSDPATQGEPNTAAEPSEYVPRPQPGVWTLYEGRWPVVTLVILGLSIGLTAMAHFAENSLPQWVYSSGYDIWAENRFAGVFTSIFLHVGLLHLFFNCYWFWYLGRVLEPKLGAVRYSVFMAGSAWATGIGELAVSGNPGVGLSGVLYALFGYMLVNRRRDPMFGLLLPRGTVMVLLAWLFICLGLTYTNTMAIANGAHFAGFAIGCAVGYFSRISQRRVVVTTLVFAVLFSWPISYAPWHEAWLLAQATRLIDAKRRPEAEPFLERSLQKNAQNEGAWIIITQLQVESGRYAKAKSSYITALPHSEGPTLPNNFAWLLCTCPDAAIRNGELAVTLAKRACELSIWKEAGFIDTYAAALAETGDFAGAIEWMEKAIALDPNNKAVYQQHLAAFRAGRPWRESPAL